MGKKIEFDTRMTDQRVTGECFEQLPEVMAREHEREKDVSEMSTVDCANKREQLNSTLCHHDEETAYLIRRLESLAKSYENNLSTIRDHGWSRDVDEIKAERNDMLDKLWYNRHMYSRYQAENEGKYLDPESWETALQLAQKIKDKFGEKNLLLDDFEWGMLNGKISALRWVLGDEWDNLDT